MREVSPFAQHSVSTLALTCPHRLRPRLQELQTIAQAGASGSEVVVPAGLAQPKGVGEFRRKPREGPQRRMVDHRLPPYVECNFRSLHFMMVRFPKVSDFPREKCARPAALPPYPEGPWAHVPIACALARQPAGVLTRPPAARPPAARLRHRVSARCPPVGIQLGRSVTVCSSFS